MASSVGENSRSDDAFAASNLRFVMLGRASDSPRIIFIRCRVSMTGGVRGQFNRSSFHRELAPKSRIVFTLHDISYTIAITFVIQHLLRRATFISRDIISSRTRSKDLPKRRHATAMLCSFPI